MSLSDETLAPLFSELDALRRRIALYRDPVLRLRLAMNARQGARGVNRRIPVNATLWSDVRRWSASLEVEAECAVSIDYYQPFHAEAPALRRILDTMIDLDLSSIEACPATGLALARGGQARALRLGSGEPFWFELGGGWAEFARGARVLEDGARVAVAYAEEVLPMLSAHERLELEEWRAAFRAYAPDHIDDLSYYHGKIEVARNGDLGYVIATDPISAKIFAVANLADASSSTRATT